MPLGFAKSTFTYGVAAAAGGNGYWQQAGAVQDTNNVAQKFTYNSQPSTVTDYTFACWFKVFSRTSGNDSGNVDDFDPDFQEFEPLRATNGNYNLIVSFHENNGIQAMLFGLSQGGGTTYGTGNLSGTFRETYCDDEWHHLYVQARFGTSTANSKIFLDGVDKTSNALGSTETLSGSSSFASNQVVTFSGRDGSVLKETSAQLSQVYFEPGDSQNNISNVSRFYDSGLVDMGTDGDDSGLTTPDVYLYVDSTPAVVQGGSAAGTLGLTSSNTMTVSASGGPD